MSTAVDKLDFSSQASKSEPIILGHHVDGTAAEYVLHNTPNFNVLAVGQSGVGKTYLIKRLIREYFRRGITTLVLDTQGDLDEYPDVDPSFIHSITFGYSDSATINPLTVPTYAGGGGLHIAIREVINCIKVFYPGLGTRQTEDWMLVLQGLYRKFGFKIDDPSTWDKDPPTWQDLRSYLESLLSYRGDKLVKMIMDLQDKYFANPEQDEEKRKKFEDELAAEFIEGMREARSESGGTMDPILLEHNWKYQQLDRLQKMAARIDSTRLFGEDKITIKPGRINRFSLRELHPSDQQVMYRLILDRVFGTAVRSNKKTNPSHPEMIVVLDEGKHASINARSPLSSLNRIGTEGRKFGLGALIGVQYIGQMTDDLLSNIALYLCFPQTVTKWSEMKARLKVNEDDLCKIKPRSECLVVNNSGHLRSIKVTK
jgi:hypothetical protein